VDPFLAEIRLFAGDFAPQGWALCNGQLMPIAQNSALFSLVGITYGGDGRSTFALPDLRGAMPMHAGPSTGATSTRSPGETGGQTAVTLSAGQIPAHTHLVQASTAAGTRNSPTGAVLGRASFGRRVDRPYATSGVSAALNPGATGVAGASQPHGNLPPYLTVTFIIALQGVYPQRP
jgi:microcystin-dependent protein